jgi:hypothetical protein
VERTLLMILEILDPETNSFKNLEVTENDINDSVSNDKNCNL